MTAFTRYESLVNQETKEERFTFKTPTPDVYIVVKYFDPHQREKMTMKVFSGMYEAVRSHWRTLMPFEAPAERWSLAESQIRELLSMIGAQSEKQELQLAEGPVELPV